MLLLHEIQPSPKVNIYLGMGREAAAIRSAVKSGDPELILNALGFVLERKKIRETASLIRALHMAISTRAIYLLVTHLPQIGDMGALRLVLLETGRLKEATLVDIGIVNEIRDTSEYINGLKRITGNISRSSSSSLSSSSSSNVGENGTLRYASYGDLLARAIVDVHDKPKRRDMLAKLRRELQVPDRRFFWVCLESMAEVADFESIEVLSYLAGSGRPPPIGLMDFVKTCIKHDMEDEAVKYAMRMRDRSRALARCGRGREAADIASRLTNQQLLAGVQELTARNVANWTNSRERSKASSSVSSSSSS